MTSGPLSICMFSNLFAPIASGSSVQAGALSRELARRGHRVAVITARVCEDTPEHETLDGVHVYRIPATRLPRMSLALNFPWLSHTFTPGNQRRIASILREHQPDVLHLHNHMFDLSFSAVRMRRRFRKPLVITIHTVVKHARRLYNMLLYPGDRLFLRYAVVNKATTLVCPDANVQEYVESAFGKVRTALVPYGIDVPQPPSDEAVREIRERYRLAGKRVILSLGHVHEIRDRRDLVEALPSVLKAFPNAVLLIVGAVATDTPALLARKLGVQDAVTLAGPLPHADVPALLAVADLEAHWLNQDRPERTSMGVATLEAMAAGKVVLTAANENTYGRGVMENGRNAIFVEPRRPDKLAQAIVELLGDEPRRKAIGAAAAMTIKEHFSWPVVCERTLGVYRDAMPR